MSTVAEIEAAIETLSPTDFVVLATWVSEKQAAQVDASLEHAVLSGKFDAMADNALRDAAAGKAIPLDEFLRRA